MTLFGKGGGAVVSVYVIMNELRVAQLRGGVAWSNVPSAAEISFPRRFPSATEKVMWSTVAVRLTIMLLVACAASTATASSKDLERARGLAMGSKAFTFLERSLLRPGPRGRARQHEPRPINTRAGARENKNAVKTTQRPVHMHLHEPTAPLQLAHSLKVPRAAYIYICMYIYRLRIRIRSSAGA